MITVKKSFMIFVSLFSLIACSQKPIVTSEATTSASVPSATPWVEGTEMALASPTPWVAGTETALAVLSPSSTPTLVPSLTPLPTFTPAGIPPFPTFTPYPLPEGTFSPVLYGNGSFLLLGGIKKGDGWISGSRRLNICSMKWIMIFLIQRDPFKSRGVHSNLIPLAEITL